MDTPRLSWLERIRHRIGCLLLGHGRIGWNVNPKSGWTEDHCYFCGKTWRRPNIRTAYTRKKLAEENLTKSPEEDLTKSKRCEHKGLHSFTPYEIELICQGRHGIWHCHTCGHEWEMNNDSLMESTRRLFQNKMDEERNR